ncbi:hypothetical protein [Qipengyuania soli]|uniref:Uncharacterized protein n=1 Tax=Qipengyuania soli TaxID=2782568 RepID=A0A7S8F4X7_9SPHN|nr:hypothetical protein [Qipengyuania soli]QPC99264.1 hypothetical protein IRL76_01385 [Qipengyuania soli]
MFGKIIGAFVGDKLAKQTSAVGGAGGAALGVVAATVLRRMSLPAMIALGAGGYVAKKLIEKNEREKAAKSATTTADPDISPRQAA